MHSAWEWVTLFARTVTILPIVAAAVVAACDHLRRSEEGDGPESFSDREALSARR